MERGEARRQWGELCRQANQINFQVRALDRFNVYLVDREMWSDEYRRLFAKFLRANGWL